MIPRRVRDAAWRYDSDVTDTEAAEAVLIATALQLFKAVRDRTGDQYRLGLEFDDAAQRLLVLYEGKS